MVTPYVSNGVQGLVGGSQDMKESSSGTGELSFDGSASHGCMLGTSKRVIGEYRWGNPTCGYIPCNLRSSGMDLGVIDMSLRMFLGKKIITFQR
jgi:hypothetical protein